ncbi:MAG: NfeD family protein [Muribaculum sp.]|nr:NfeD family protein [Muribaculaceae bacterium]MCM1081088.1 NfeD family protein [Muribaculum sp.]
MASWLIWLIIAAVLATVELLFGAFAAFCPAIGAICAAVTAGLGLGLEGQLIALILGGVAAFIFLGPLVNKNLHKGNQYSSNMDALIGRESVVTESYTAEKRPGRLRIDGDNWQFVSNNGESIESGTAVKVVGYDSIILKVKVIK